MQSITTLISLDEALRRAYEAVKATAAEDYGHDGKLYIGYLESHLRRAFAEPPMALVPEGPEIDACSQCGEHADWDRDEHGYWESRCCGARPVEIDAGAWS